MFVVDVSNVSYHQTFVKKKVEKSLLFRFGLEFFDFVSPMVLATLSLDAVGSKIFVTTTKKRNMMKTLLG